jgi:hypothetical protein
MIGCNVVIDLSQEMIRNAIQQYEMNADRGRRRELLRRISFASIESSDGAKVSTNVN